MATAYPLGLCLCFLFRQRCVRSCAHMDAVSDVWARGSFSKTCNSVKIMLSMQFPWCSTKAENQITVYARIINAKHRSCTCTRSLSCSASARTKDGAECCNCMQYNLMYSIFLLNGSISSYFPFFAFFFFASLFVGRINFTE